MKSLDLNQAEIIECMRGVTVCVCVLQKWLNGSTSCLGWRLSGSPAQRTLGLPIITLQRGEVGENYAHLPHKTAPTHSPDDATFDEASAKLLLPLGKRCCV